MQIYLYIPILKIESRVVHGVFELGSEKRSNEEPTSNHHTVGGAPGVWLQLHLLLLCFPCALRLQYLWWDRWTEIAFEGPAVYFWRSLSHPSPPIKNQHGEISGRLVWVRNSVWAFLATNDRVWFDTWMWICCFKACILFFGRNYPFVDNISKLDVI